jgi:hypothetical protein
VSGAVARSYPGPVTASYDERIDDTTDRIGWQELLEYHWKQPALAASFTLNNWRQFRDWIAESGFFSVENLDTFSATLMSV